MMMVASMMANGGNDDDEVDLRVRRLQDQRVSGALSKTMLQRRRKRNLVKFLKIGDEWWWVAIGDVFLFFLNIGDSDE